jgi:transforming growth factor-beta-induced protein
MKQFKLFSAFLVLALILAACGAAATPTPTPEPVAEPTEEVMVMDIVDTTIAADGFETLVNAVQAAGLVDALKGEGPFTVFAPTDDAFNALPEGTLEALLADPEGDLTSILLYHVISGKVMAESVADGLEAETLQGAPVAFSVTEDGAMINGAKIIATDIETSNGVIHVIDAVILPPAEG